MLLVRTRHNITAMTSGLTQHSVTGRVDQPEAHHFEWRGLRHGGKSRHLFLRQPEDLAIIGFHGQGACMGGSKAWSS